MKNFFLTLHMLSMCLVVGTLFLQSLSVVLRLRLKSAHERVGLKKTQVRIHKFIYYPILFVTVASGIYLAIKTGVFDEAQWIYPKLGLLLVLVALGFQNGRQIKQPVTIGKKTSCCDATTLTPGYYSHHNRQRVVARWIPRCLPHQPRR